MNKFSVFTISVMGLAAMTAQANDFTVLTTPEDVYNNSIEITEGAKATFKAVLDNADATDADKVAAMQTYQQSADPAPGYAFNMSYLLSCTVAEGETPNKTLTQEKLAAAWKTDIEGLTFTASNSPLAASYNAEYGGAFIRVNSNLLKSTDDSEKTPDNKFAAYQEVTLSKGVYHLQSQGFVRGAANAANLAAGNNLSETKFAGAPLRDYSVDFKMTATEPIKIGYWRNDTKGALTMIGFNNLELYKLSEVLVIKDDATGALSNAEVKASVQLQRTFNAGEYTPICLPFIVTDWRNVFDECLALTKVNGTELTFAGVAGQNTMARKPYLVKMKEDVTPENYLLFSDVTVTTGKPGAWLRENPAGHEDDPLAPYFFVGNWAATTVPANCYYLDGEDWRLSDGTTPIKAFSAYIDGSRMAEAGETLPTVLSIVSSSKPNAIIENFESTSDSSVVNVYNLQGMIVKHGANASNPTEGLPAGLYIIKGKKIVKH